LVQTLEEAPLIVVTSKEAPNQAIEALRSLPIEVLFADGDTDSERIGSALDGLGQRGITSLLLEGGPGLTGAFQDAGEIDEVLVFIASLLLGGESARSPIDGIGVEKISEGSSARLLEWREIDGDILLRARLRDW
jgi:diaminohydroxyphosphoribosylaminopyrimidine deaminase/5-amino-6-(5-phosphoribosylamino)uracil reductase